MKDNTANKNVLRAISIGLAAMMAITSMPLDVMADDSNSTDSENKNTYNETGHESQKADEAREAMDNAIETVEHVAEQVNSVVEIPTLNENIASDLEDANELPDDMKKVADTLTVVDANLTIVDEYLKQENISQITGSGYDEIYNANVQAYIAAVAIYGVNGPEVPSEDADEETKKAYEDFQKIKEEIEKQLAADDQLANDILKPAIEDITEENFVDEKSAIEKQEKAFNEGKEIAENAAKEQKKADTAGKEATQLVDDTEKLFDEYVGNIESSTTIEDVNKSYDKLVDILNDASTSLEEKQAIYDAAKQAYEEYKISYEEKQAEIEAAEKEYEKAQAKYNDALIRYGNMKDANEKKINALNNYHTSLEDAEAKCKEAEEELANIAEKAEGVSNAADAAKAAMLEDQKAAMDIVAQIDVVKNLSKDNKVDWNEEDKLFMSIMEKYYLPKVLDAKEIVSMDWQKPVKSDGNYNYFVVEYKDADGNTVTKYYDYKREDSSDNRTSEQIVIFEKRDNEMEAGKVIGKNKNAYLYKDGVDVDYYTANGEKITKEQLQEGLAGDDEKAPSIVVRNGIYYKNGNIVIKGVVEQNKNFHDKNPDNFVESSDENFKSFIDLEAREKYVKECDDLAEDAKKAKEELEEAKRKVEELKGKIDGIKENNDIKDADGRSPLALLKNIIGNYSLGNLEDFLSDAEEELADAQKRLDNIKDQMKEVEAKKDEKIKELTPKPSRNEPEENRDGSIPGAPTPSGELRIDPIEGDVEIEDTYLIDEMGADSGVAGVRLKKFESANGAKLVESTDNELKVELPEKIRDVASEKLVKKTTKAVRVIEDEKVPLANPSEDSAKKMSWWWLLIIAILGTTGEEMYRRNKKKKEEQAMIDTQIKK